MNYLIIEKKTKIKGEQTNWFDNIFIESPETIWFIDKYHNIFKYEEDLVIGYGNHILFLEN